MGKAGGWGCIVEPAGPGDQARNLTPKIIARIVFHNGTIERRMWGVGEGMGIIGQLLLIEKNTKEKPPKDDNSNGDVLRMMAKIKNIVFPPNNQKVGNNAFSAKVVDMLSIFERDHHDKYTLVIGCSVLDRGGWAVVVKVRVMGNGSYKSSSTSGNGTAAAWCNSCSYCCAKVTSTTASACCNAVSRTMTKSFFPVLDCKR